MSVDGGDVSGVVGIDLNVSGVELKVVSFRGSNSVTR